MWVSQGCPLELEDWQTYWPRLHEEKPWGHCLAPARLVQPLWVSSLQSVGKPRLPFYLCLCSCPTKQARKDSFKEAAGVCGEFIQGIQHVGCSIRVQYGVHIGKGRIQIDVYISCLLSLHGLRRIAVQTVQGLAGIVAHDDLALADSDIGSDNNITYLIFS